MHGVVVVVIHLCLFMCLCMPPFLLQVSPLLPLLRPRLAAAQSKASTSPCSLPFLLLLEDGAKHGRRRKG